MSNVPTLMVVNKGRNGNIRVGVAGAWLKQTKKKERPKQRTGQQGQEPPLRRNGTSIEQVSRARNLHCTGMTQVLNRHVPSDGPTEKSWECLRPHCRSRSIGPVVGVAAPTATDFETVWRRGPELVARTRGTPEGG